MPYPIMFEDQKYSGHWISAP